MTITVTHDGLARQSTVREIVPTSETCSWCGQSRRRLKDGTFSGTPSLYRYGTEPDDRPGRVNWHKGLFCSKGCHDDYHR